MSTRTSPKLPPMPPEPQPSPAAASAPAAAPAAVVPAVPVEPVASERLTPRIRRFFSQRINQLGVGVCAGMLLLFAILGFSAVVQKSPTYDEPLHAMGAWANLHLGDFRINFEDPPLWKYWAAIPNGRNSVLFEPDLESWVNMPGMVYRGWDFANHTLFQTPGTDGAAFINRSRFMMVLLGITLGVVMAIWAWQLGGPIAAMIATVLFALDPNLLGHAAMVKNDVPMGLLLLAAFHAMWRAGQKLTWLNAMILAVLVAMAVNTKFSALLMAPMLVAIVAVRAALPIPWDVLGRTYARLLPKAVAGSILLAAIVVVTYFGIWASYGFRYNPSPDPNIQLNTTRHKVEAIRYRFQATHRMPPLRPFNLTLSLRQYAEELQAKLGQTLQVYNQDVATLRAMGAGEPTKATGGSQANGSNSQADLQPALSDESIQTINAGLRSAEDTLRKLDQAAVEANNWARMMPSPGEDMQAFAENKARVTLQTYNALSAATDMEYGLRLFQYWEKVGDRAPDSFIAFLNIFFDHHLLPSAWLHGVLFVHARSMVRGSFLLGETSPTGWWYYFPVAALLKTPVATLIVVFASLGIGAWVALLKHKRWEQFIWPLACLLVPFLIYMASAMGSNLNIGIRHILPMYPLVYIAAGVLVAFALRRRRQIVLVGMCACGLLLAAETLGAWPNYIAYFNFASRIVRDPIDMLADSNLDWGQDLPLLKKWQDQHPDVPLAFGPWMAVNGKSGSYFGSIDPKFYGIKADPFWIGPPTAPENPKDLLRTHAVAISATFLQGVYGGPFTKFRSIPPTDVLGGTIYIYDLRNTPFANPQP